MSNSVYIYSSGQQQGEMCLHLSPAINNAAIKYYGFPVINMFISSDEPL